jgi:aspartate/tyrosine/aromatic aminotransferase
MLRSIRKLSTRSIFNNVFSKVDEDIIFKTQSAFNADKSKTKVNLGIGIYSDADGKLPPIQSRYLPISGDPDFLNASERFVFGKQINNLYKFQTCGGTGALSLASQIVNLTKNFKYIIPLPTWPNHLKIFNKLNLASISYDSKINNKIVFPKIYSSNSVLVIQTSCHNPTGIEYVDNEKKYIIDYAEENNSCLIFDTAYLGLSGDFNKEVNFINMALNRNIDIMICLSYSKIADVYGHRIGALFFRPKISNLIEYQHIKPTIENLIRTNISNSPRYGSDIILEKYLSDDNKMLLFKQKINDMAQRINLFRKRLGEDLNRYNINNDVAVGRGMFSLLNLTDKEIFNLQQNYSIYILPNGRINICGLTNQNYNYVVDSILKVKNRK